MKKAPLKLFEPAFCYLLNGEYEYYKACFHNEVRFQNWDTGEDISCSPDFITKKVKKFFSMVKLKWCVPKWHLRESTETKRVWFISIRVCFETDSLPLCQNIVNIITSKKFGDRFLITDIVYGTNKRKMIQRHTKHKQTI